MLWNVVLGPLCGAFHKRLDFVRVCANKDARQLISYISVFKWVVFVVCHSFTKFVFWCNTFKWECKCGFYKLTECYIYILFEILNVHSIPSKCYILHSKVRNIVSSVISPVRCSSSPAGGSHGWVVFWKTEAQLLQNHPNSESYRIYLVTMVISI